MTVEEMDSNDNPGDEAPVVQSKSVVVVEGSNAGDAAGSKTSFSQSVRASAPQCPEQPAALVSDPIRSAPDRSLSTPCVQPTSSAGYDGMPPSPRSRRDSMGREYNFEIHGKRRQVHCCATFAPPLPSPVLMLFPPAVLAQILLPVCRGQPIQICVRVGRKPLGIRCSHSGAHSYQLDLLGNG